MSIVLARCLRNSSPTSLKRFDAAEVVVHAPLDVDSLQFSAEIAIAGKHVEKIPRHLDDDRVVAIGAHRG